MPRTRPTSCTETAQRAGRLTPLITALLNKNPAKRPTIPQAQQLLNPPQAPPPRRRATAAVVLSVVTLVVLVVVARLISDGGGRTRSGKHRQDAADGRCTAASVLTDSNNVFFTLRSSAVQNCITGNEQPVVQRVLDSANCTNAIAKTYVNYYLDRILISVWLNYPGNQ